MSLEQIFSMLSTEPISVALLEVIESRVVLRNRPIHIVRSATPSRSKGLVELELNGLRFMVGHVRPRLDFELNRRKSRFEMNFD